MLKSEIDELRADIKNLRDQLTTGVGLPNYSDASENDALSIVSGFPTWKTPVVSVSWGGIIGTLASQTDLNSALNARGKLASSNSWSGYNLFSNGNIDFSGSNGRVTIGASYTFTSSQLGCVSVRDDGAANWGSQFASIANVGINKKASFAFFPTFNYAPDQNPRCAAHLIAGFTGIWGTEYLDICVGKGVLSNDSASLTTQIARFTDGQVEIFGALKLPGTTGQYVRGDGSRATFPSGSGVTSVSAGNGMTFSTITGTGAVTMGTPSTCTDSTTNATTSGSHTHNITGLAKISGQTFTGAITAPGVTDSSDIKFKTNIRILCDGLYIVNKLNPVRFFNKLTENQEVGFVAQEVEKVIPEIVIQDENGDLAISYQRLVAPIISALQSIDKRLNKLENR